MSKAIVVFSILIISIICLVQSFVDVTDINCQFNNDLCTHPICSKSTSKTRIKISFINAGCFLIKPVNNANIRITLYRKSGNTFNHFLIDTEEDVCQFIKNSMQNPLLSQTFQSISDRLRSIRCPLEGNVTIAKLPLLLNLPPGIFPDTQYKIGAYLHQNKKFIFAVNITFNKDKGRLL